MAESAIRRNISTQVLFLFPLLSLLYLSGGEMAMAPMEKTEKEALYLAIQGFLGNWWNGSDLYPDPCGWTPIQGVSCDLFDDLWYITILSIGPVLENSLDCSPNSRFTRSLFELKHLKSLSFFNCFSANQSITLPSNGWDKLAVSLEILEFRSNKGLVGEIPIEVFSLTNLQSLVLMQTGLFGKLPDEIDNLINLKRLSLAGNRFMGSLPNSFGKNMNELLILDLSSNSLSGSIPSSIGGLTSLLKLDISNNLFSGSLHPELASLKNLTLLDLRNNCLSGGWVQSLQGMFSLQDMLLSNNPLGGNLVDFGWEKLQNLSNLDLSNTGITGVIPESIAGLRRLRFLALDNNHLSGKVSPKLADLPDLNVLYLSGNNFTGELDFSEEFFERMGRRFTAWNNRNLCYRAGRFVPFGVELCREEGVAVQNSKNKFGVGSQDPESGFVASFGLQTCSSSNENLAVILIQVIVTIFLLLQRL
ncbi:Piriformospora indica-insensitive protein 2 [Dendrobium catenatum]|uniref:Piriformospora indica-insensitive protein 2 n=1 Tax=Dendrobium catenatum TaxID=906689 RepID=A0A2I0WRI4_9ASPA|nr:Piriformospora indica-insensitive protein 2 [Dendrobium catenatum]